MSQKKNIYFNGSYLSLAEQKEMLGDNYVIYNSYHIGEKKTKKHFFYWVEYLFKNFYINFTSKEKKKSHIQVFNSIIGCFFLDTTKTNILILHSYDIGINSNYVSKNTSSYIKKILIFIGEKVLGKYIRKKIQSFDTVFVSTYDRYEYIKNHIRKDVIFLPNVVEITGKNLPKEKSIKGKVFCPERIDKNKGLEKRKEIISFLHNNFQNIEFFMIQRGNDTEEFTSWLQKENIQVHWLPYLTSTELYRHIVSSELVLGIFNNGGLSITNMETMLLKTPIVTYDKWEILKNILPEILTYCEKIMRDEEFKKQEVEKNYSYISSVHSLKNYKRIFTSRV